MIDNLKMMLGIASDDTDCDEKLRLIVANTTARLRILLGGVDPPEELDHIVLDVSIIRFNKIGSEGMKSHTVEGESVQFSDDDFSGYMDEINAYLETQSENSRGKVHFI